MRDLPAAESRTPSVVYVDADVAQRRLFEAEFGERFRLTLSSSAGELLERVDLLAPVAALLCSSTSS
jgi:hypothetical protein